MTTVLLPSNTRQRQPTVTYTIELIWLPLLQLPRDSFRLEHQSKRTIASCMAGVSRDDHSANVSDTYSQRYASARFISHNVSTSSGRRGNPGRVIRPSLGPICSTMPWTIWSALAVLWGVCWMFYYPPGGIGQPGPKESQSWIDENKARNDELVAGLSQVSTTTKAFRVPGGPRLPQNHFAAPPCSAWVGPRTSDAILHDLGTSNPNGPASCPTTYETPGARTQWQQDGIASLFPTPPPRVETLNRDEVFGDCHLHSSQQPTSTSRVQCPVCFRTFANTFTLSGHRQTKHGKAKEYSCPNLNCPKPRSKPFQRKDHLDRHLKGSLPCTAFPNSPATRNSRLLLKNRSKQHRRDEEVISEPDWHTGPSLSSPRSPIADPFFSTTL